MLDGTTSFGETFPCFRTGRLCLQAPAIRHTVCGRERPASTYVRPATLCVPPLSALLALPACHTHKGFGAAKPSPKPLARLKICLACTPRPGRPDVQGRVPLLPCIACLARRPITLRITRCPAASSGQPAGASTNPRSSNVNVAWFGPLIARGWLAGGLCELLGAGVWRSGMGVSRACNWGMPRHAHVLNCFSLVEKAAASTSGLEGGLMPA